MLFFVSRGPYILPSLHNALFTHSFVCFGRRLFGTGADTGGRPCQAALQGLVVLRSVEMFLASLLALAVLLFYHCVRHN